MIPKLKKGSPRPPQPQPGPRSYTQGRASKAEVTIKRGNEKGNPITATEFSSQIVPQPFLDPSIMERRIAAEKQWAADKEKIEKQTAMSSQP
ncbi:hypothetical protein BJ875DRAFT_266712 [Amylocarpus encephaloides]|uniref:Uncharacterized protein n=1 Tax=Amylocarpus encephaloides TaxID=45428 RepID=A0A9P7YL97_9HELO|nr:hypothetical protein BJ875DRAFT_266712 [Amylocarpus encephaloides]